MEYEEDIFKLIQLSKNNYELYGLILGYVKKVDYQCRGEENESHYQVLRMIEHSINNAGHEERRRDLISKIWIIQHKITDKYGDNFI